MAAALFARANTSIIFGVYLLFATQGFAIEYIVKLKQNLKNYDFEQLSISSNSTLKVIDYESDLKLINVKAKTNTKDTIDDLKLYFDADYVVENVSLYAYFSPSDPKVSDQWALGLVGAFAAWDISLGSHNVVVAVIDTGIDTSHEDLSGNIWTNAKETQNGLDDDNNGYADDLHGWDFHGNDNDPRDETSAANPGHGTHCSGIIGAMCGNQKGICGISPTVSLMPLRFLGSDGSGDLFAAVKAIEYAAKNGAHIISASWGASIPESSAQPLIDAIKNAEQHGVIFVAAAGNEGKSNDRANSYPANAQTPHMISVAASNSSDSKPPWSNYGRKVDIAAPGEDILSTVPGDYKNLSGTSMATPLVSGVVALMKSIDATLTGAEARSIIQSTGHNVAIDTASNRRISAENALKAVVEKKLTLVPAAHTLSTGDKFTFSAWGGAPPYRYRSLQPEIATISESGELSALADGTVVVEVVDSNNTVAQYVSILVVGAPQGGSDCPFEDPLICMIACVVNPEFEWCGESALPPLPDLPDLPELPGLPL